MAVKVVDVGIATRRCTPAIVPGGSLTTLKSSFCDIYHNGDNFLRAADARAQLRIEPVNPNRTAR
jgi:hypothetical protein